MDSVNNDSGIVVASTFDGMSCARIALERAGKKVKKYYAIEIDKHAIKVTQANYPDTIQLGDICNVKGSDLGWVDLICGGSPCQGFSFAGKGLNFEDPRSKLFFEFMRLYKELKEINPDIKFFLENVQMKYEHELVISRLLGVNPIVINAALVSAQNRVRNYWTNINARPVGLFGEMEPDIPQPKDLGIILRDILEEEVEEKYFLSKKALDRINRNSSKLNPDKTYSVNTHNNASGAGNKRSSTLIGGVFFDESFRPIGDKSLNLDANYSKGPDNNGQRTVVHVTKLDIDGNKKANQEKASALTVGGHGAGNHSDMDVIHVQRKVIQVNEAEQFGTQPQQQNRVYDPDGISPALLNDLSSGSHHIIVHNKMPRTGGKKQGGTGPLKREDGKTYALNTVPVNEIEFRPIQIDTLYPDDGQAGRIYSDKGKSVSIKGEAGGGGSKTGYYETESRIRRLTPRECERLQCVPDDYTKHVSDTQRYRMLGNGWCVDVIVHFFKFLK